MLLHLDGSQHRWFADDRWYDLLVVLDDGSSGIYYAQLVEQESTRTVLAALRELGIQMIPAYSPQARGRGERNFGTWQGRLPQELRLRGDHDAKRPRMSSCGRAISGSSIGALPCRPPNRAAPFCRQPDGS